MSLTVEEQLGYEPCPAVVAAHGIPHVDQSGSISSNEFHPTMEYAMSIVTVPIVILALGLLSLFIYHFICCCCKCECVKKHFSFVDTVKPDEEVTEDRAQKIRLHRRLTIAFFLALLGGLVVSNNMFVAGNASISTGVDKVVTVFDFLIGMSNDVIHDTSAMGNTTGEFRDYLQAASDNDGCTQVGDAIDLSDMVSDAANNVANMLKVVPNTLTDAKDVFTEYAVDRKNEIMDYVYIVCWVFIGIYAIGCCFRSKLYYRVIIWLAGLLVLILTLVCCIEMALVTGMGDYCMKPNTILLDGVGRLMGDDSDYPDMVENFMVCNGENVLANFLNSTKDNIAEMNSTLYQYSQTGCQNNDNVNAALALIPELYTELDSLFDNLSCSPIKYSLYTLLNEGFCKYTVTGVYTIWVGLFIFSGFLFFLNFTAGILYQYFDPIMWNMGSGTTTNENANPDEAPVAVASKVDYDDGHVEMQEHNKVAHHEGLSADV